MEMRQQILAEAERLFAAGGYEGTSLQDIAKAVGIKKASLLYHFSSKQELHRGVLERMLMHWQEALPRLLLAATGGLQRFDAIAGELVGFFTENPDRARLMLREALDRPTQLRATIVTHVTPWVAAVCDNIRMGQRQGRIHPDVDPENYVINVVALVLTSVATFDTVGAVVGASVSDRTAPEEAVKAARVRHLAELLRVARSSLFKPRTPAAAIQSNETTGGATHAASTPKGR